MESRGPLPVLHPSTGQLPLSAFPPLPLSLHSTPRPGHGRHSHPAPDLSGPGKPLTICFLRPTANTIPTTQLATQFYATLGYLTTYHDNSPATPPPNVPNAAPALAKSSKNIPSPPIPASVAAGTAGGASAAQQASPIPPPTQQPDTIAGEAPEAGAEDPNLPPQPDSPRTFAARQRELARDLIIKEQQIEYLISVLPGIGASESEQEARIRELEAQLRDVEKERAAKALELRRLRGRLDGVLGAMSVGIYGDREGLTGGSIS